VDAVQSLAEMPFVAGQPALDFVNTAEERGHPEAGDVLVTPADLRLWGARYGLVAGSLRLDADAPAELERALDARELLYGLFLARVRGRVLPRAPLARLAELAAEAHAAGGLAVNDDGTVGWRWSRSELATIRHVAVTAGVELLQTAPAPRIKQCPGDHCGWLFIDATKRGNRRWCLMSECGQNAKVRRRRDRRGELRLGS